MERPTAPGPRRHVKVAILDESELVMHGLRAMLEPHAAVISLVHHRADGPAPLCDLTLYEPHSRTAGVRPAPQRFPTRMVAFGWDCSPEAVSTEMARGAAGFVSKWLPSRRLIWNLLQVAEGRRVVDDWTPHAEAQQAAASKWPLTQRETEVLSMIAAGKANREIAEDTNLSINSVKSYIRGAYSKIEVSSRSQAVLWAIQHGLLMPSDVQTTPPPRVHAPRTSYTAHAAHA
ncbi:DNA-binding NarL/FixJ family response regulator [Nocardioides cavernae]|uniref:DNA-binding NarL/FixJ family response regulator n=1 Tax=Nocardioides cavernae TaxID=1921566 RepID=A0A7Y9KTE7_9ACTN|nr:response regulator transcription factor [Nocardioides cavernae]NYE36763.1 DNA-binding NarL/FixJ family response regulator [Nocardioides cavernae]